MEAVNNKSVLISGASFAGLSAAWWMNQLGYRVTVVEVAPALKMGGTPVNFRGNTVSIVQRMGLWEQIKQHKLTLALWEFKNADDVTEGSMMLMPEGEPVPDDEAEIERDTLLSILFDAVKNDATFLFGNSVTALHQIESHMQVTFKDGTTGAYNLVLGCDGIHSAVRRLWFGPEAQYLHFLDQYFSVTIVNKLLIPQNTAQMFNVPDKAVMLNAYNGKTDIVFCFRTDHEIPYDYRNEAQQREIIESQFAGQAWRTAELLQEVRQSPTFYFDKLCQIKMPAWTKGRVTLVGDAGYCASPAAGMGGSLAIDGAAALADAFIKYPDSYEQAFQEYNQSFRPFIEQVQAEAVSFGLEALVPRTEEAIRKRNLEGF